MSRECWPLRWRPPECRPLWQCDLWCILGSHPPVNRQTGVKTLPCPKLHLRAVIKLLFVFLYEPFLLINFCPCRSTCSLFAMQELILVILTDGRLWVSLKSKKKTNYKHYPYKQLRIRNTIYSLLLHRFLVISRKNGPITVTGQERLIRTRLIRSST